ncbi:hypothetical protein [Phenylobacterium sp.]|uniref:hypothetical protein n=1 Tax=Phenylobacterium sp. TaxID=1871053 RepID=UPI0035B05504
MSNHESHFTGHRREGARFSVAGAGKLVATALDRQTGVPSNLLRCSANFRLDRKFA